MGLISLLVLPAKIPCGLFHVRLGTQDIDFVIRTNSLVRSIPGAVKLYFGPSHVKVRCIHDLLRSLESFSSGARVYLNF